MGCDPRSDSVLVESTCSLSVKHCHQNQSMCGVSRGRKETRCSDPRTPTISGLIDSTLLTESRGRLVPNGIWTPKPSLAATLEGTALRGILTGDDMSEGAGLEGDCGRRAQTSTPASCRDSGRTRRVGLKTEVDDERVARQGGIGNESSRRLLDTLSMSRAPETQGLTIWVSF